MTIRTQTPLRLDRLQIGIGQALTLAYGNVASGGPLITFSYQEQSFEQVPVGGLVALTIVSGPAPFLRSGKRGTLLNAVATIPLTVTTATVGVRYLVRLNDFDYFHDAVGGDSVTTIRDSLIAQIEADTFETATATTLAADGLTLAADFVGGLRTLQVSGPITAGAPVASGSSVLVTEGDQQLLLGIQCFSKNREPFSGALAMIAVAEATFQTESMSAVMSRFGVGVAGKGPVTDLSAIAGGHWETRASFDVTLAAHAAWVDQIERIESVDTTIDFTEPAVSVNFTTTAI